MLKQYLYYLLCMTFYLTYFFILTMPERGKPLAHYCLTYPSYIINTENFKICYYFIYFFRCYNNGVADFVILSQYCVLHYTTNSSFDHILHLFFKSISSYWCVRIFLHVISTGVDWIFLRYVNNKAIITVPIL